MDTTNVFNKNLDAFLDGKTLIINRGGSSSSKTFSILELLIIIAHKRKYLISVVSETMPHLKKGAMKDFFDILKNDGLYVEALHNKTDNSYQFNEGKIEFFSCDSPSKVHGPRRDILFINECQNVPKEIYEQLEIRTKICTFLDFNPTAPFWVLDLPQNKETIEIVSTYKDNQFLPPKIVRGIEARRETHPEWFKTYGLGEWGQLEGVIFTNWKQVPEIPKDAKLLGFGLDWGFTTDPTAVVEVRMMDGQLWLKELLYETDLTNRDVSKKLDEIGIIRGIDEIWADSAEPKSIKELRDGGWLIRGASKGPDSIRKGIDLLKQYQINVTSDSVNLIRELRQYRWQKDRMTGKGINKPEPGWDHCFVGETLIHTKRGLVRIDEVTTVDSVFTSEGEKPILAKFDNGVKEVFEYTLHLNDFVITIICTKDHKIKTTEGWKPICSLTKKDTVYILVNGITGKADTICTKKFGSLIMDLYRKGCTYTTSMGTHLITESKISQLLMAVNILVNILKRGFWTILNGLVSFKKRGLRWPPNGIRVKKDECGIPTMQKKFINQDIKKATAIPVVKHSLINQLPKTEGSVPITANQNGEESLVLTMNQENAKIVVQNLSQTNIHTSNFVAPFVVLKIEEKSAGNRQVYDLMVDGCHEYFANGVLVHNCLDAVRYLCMMKVGKKRRFLKQWN